MNKKVTFLNASKQKLSEVEDINSKLNYLNDCCQCLEDLINNYKEFINDNESVYEKLYINIKDLFNYYIERIKLIEKGVKYNFINIFLNMS